MSPDPHTYLKWPRLMSFAIQEALGVTAIALAVKSSQLFKEDRSELVSHVPNAELDATPAIIVTTMMVVAAGIAVGYSAVLSVMLIFKLQKRETLKVIRIKEALMAVMTLFLLGSAIAATVIIPNGSATVSSATIPQPFLLRGIQAAGKSLTYRDSFAFPCMIVVWVCFGCTSTSCAIADLAARRTSADEEDSPLVGDEVEKQPYEGHKPPIE